MDVTPMPFPLAEVVHNGWKRQITRLVKITQSKIDVINPFIQLKTVRSVFSSFNGQLRVLTRYNEVDFYRGVSDLDALVLLLENGAHIRGIQRLHAKVYSFDQTCALVCSANLTDAAMNRNLEIGLITSEPASVAAINRNFNELWDLAGPDNLTAEKIQQWKEQVRRARRQTPVTSPTGLKDHGASVNFGAGTLTPGPAGDDVAEQSRFELDNAENYFCKFSAKSDQRPPGDKPVSEWIKDCDFTIGGFYPGNKRPRIVLDGDVMFPAVLCGNPWDTFIIGRAYAFKYVQGDDDATEAETAEPTKDWKRKWPHYIRFRDSEFLNGVLRDGVAMTSVITKFGQDSFVTSQARARRDAGFDPKRSLRQQAAVRVTYEAAKWINAQLDARFRSLGTVPFSV